MTSGGSVRNRAINPAPIAGSNQPDSRSGIESVASNTSFTCAAHETSALRCFRGITTPVAFRPLADSLRGPPRGRRSDCCMRSHGRTVEALTT